MIKLKSLIHEVVDGQNFLTKEKFGTIILSQLRREFPAFAAIELVQVRNGQEFKYEKRRGMRHNRDMKALSDRNAIYNSNLLAVLSIEYNDKEYETRIWNLFKKVPDRELTNKFTGVDEPYLKQMPPKSLEPKDLNVTSDLMVWKCCVKGEDEKVLIPKKQGYAILFDDYRNLREVIEDIKKVIDKDAGFDGDTFVIPPIPTAPNKNPVPVHEEQDNNELESTNTFQMYHGGKRWTRIPTEILGSAAGRYEAGAGIYFTNDYMTARKYAKGSRVVHLVEIDKNFKDLDNVYIPLSDVINFVNTCNGMRHKSEIIESLKRNAERMQTDGIYANILNNLMVNYQAAGGNVGIQVANYFVSKGADAHYESQHGEEFWLVIFNPKIIKKVSVIDPKTVTGAFPYLLPNPTS